MQSCVPSQVVRGPDHVPSPPRVTVRGRVQGVFFRDSCRREALAHGVAGWVVNRPDGTVEAWFEGASDAVEAMERWCHRGPARADVEGVEAETVEAAGHRDFEVR